MDLNEENKIFFLLLGGIPGIGKTYLSNKIILEYKDKYEIKYLNFDSLENINKDNYLQYQQMRTDYLLKIKEILTELTEKICNKSFLIILDDNFFLKSMRKKIYNIIFDNIIQNKISKENIYYLEIFLKPNDINYCLKMNLTRKNKKIPDNIIINMNNMFEYGSPYIKITQNIIIDINNEQSLNNFNISKGIFNNIEKYIIEKKEKFKEKIIIEKDNKAKLIDDIENIIRKEINNILKSENNKKKGKEIASYKKEYMKMIINNIRGFEQNKNIDNNKESKLFNLLNYCILNNIINISLNDDFKKIIIDGFINFLEYLLFYIK